GRTAERGDRGCRRASPVHRDRGPPPGMVGMKVGHRVIALVPVHVDDDPVERADMRHDPTIADSSITRQIANLVQDADLQLLQAVTAGQAIGPPSSRITMTRFTGSPAQQAQAVRISTSSVHRRRPVSKPLSPY